MCELAMTRFFQVKAAFTAVVTRPHSLHNLRLLSTRLGVLQMRGFPAEFISSDL